LKKFPEEGHSEKHYFVYYKLPKQKESTPKSLSREGLEKIRGLHIPKRRHTHVITRDKGKHRGKHLPRKPCFLPENSQRTEMSKNKNDRQFIDCQSFIL